MNRSSKSRVGSTSLLLGVVGMAMLVPIRAHAALDDVLAANGRDVTVTKIAEQTVRVRERGNVKEFADAHGKVFAASWKGLADLPALLGTHYAAYEAALRSNPRRSLHVAQARTTELTVSVIAYGGFRHATVVLNGRLPKGVTVDALR